MCYILFSVFHNKYALYILKSKSDASIIVIRKNPFFVREFVPDFQIYNLIKFYQYTRLKTFHPFIFPKLFEILIKSTLFIYFLFTDLIENLQFKEYLPESIYYIIETSKFYINQKYKLEKSGLYALSVSVTAFLFYCLQRLLNLSARTFQFIFLSYCSLVVSK